MDGISVYIYIQLMYGVHFWTEMTYYTMSIIVLLRISACLLCTYTYIIYLTLMVTKIFLMCSTKKLKCNVLGIKNYSHKIVVFKISANKHMHKQAACNSKYSSRKLIVWYRTVILPWWLVCRTTVLQWPVMYNTVTAILVWLF